jgi:phospholipid/cholesterol/gamma-HCH transport system substrate-binding protein
MTRGGWLGFLFFVALVIMGFSTLLIQNKSGNYFGKNQSFWAAFEHVQGLRNGNDVLVDGLIYGRVTKLTLNSGSRGAIAELSLNHDIELFEDSTVVVESSSVLGNNIVSISRGSKGSQRMSSSFTSTSPYKGAYRAGFSELSDVATENRESLKELIANLKDVSAELKNRQSTLGKIINSDELHKEAVDTLKTARETIADARTELKRVGDTVTDSLNKLTTKITDKLDKAEGPAGALLNDKALTEKLDRIVTNVEDASKNLKEMTDSVKKGDGALGKIVSDKEMGDKLKSTVDNLERVSESMKNVGNRIESGEGSVGKLLQDDELYEQAHRALDDVERLLGRASHTTLEIVGDYKDYLTTKLTITKLGVRIGPDEDKYFQASAAILGLNRFGTIAFQQQALNEDASVFKPDVVVAYRAPWLLDRHLTVRGGYLEGKAGGAADLVWEDWGCFSYPVQMTFEFRDAYHSVARENIDEMIPGLLMRAYLTVPLWIRKETWLEKLLSTVHLTVGVNRIGSTPELMAGATLQWPDEDIRTVVSLIGASH